jgi:hypothetical protein
MNECNPAHIEEPLPGLSLGGRSVKRPYATQQSPHQFPSCKSQIQTSGPAAVVATPIGIITVVRYSIKIPFGISLKTRASARRITNTGGWGDRKSNPQR